MSDFRDVIMMFYTQLRAIAIIASVIVVTMHGLRFMQDKNYSLNDSAMSVLFLLGVIDFAPWLVELLTGIKP